jgi:ABC-type multidrug transport system ATPase subunit
MMVGLLEPTQGTAVIGGHDIRTGMDAIYNMMGVCPQHDLLWETLTGREHLLFYGRLKGLEGEVLAKAVEQGLRAVNLWNGGVADKAAKQYSGGMKRRLSVAISLVGDPLVVYLDEPSTGLDPASRRNLWDVVRASKKGRAIVLTTHSMEEAETLCDRLGIFVDGRLVCVGNPKEVTSRYGGYYVFTMTVPPHQEQAARQFCSRRLAPSARLTYSVGGTLKFELPTSEVTLSAVFSAMAAAKARAEAFAAGGAAALAQGTGAGGEAEAEADARERRLLLAAPAGSAAQQPLEVLDWGVANATLEEVFIKFARQIGAKAGD